MRIFYLFIVAFFLNHGSSNVKPSKYYLTGTHVIIAVAKDGIVIASDSRSAFYDNPVDENTIPDAYWDGARKIYPIKDFVFTVSHYGSVNDTIIGFYFKQFSNYVPDKATLPEIMKCWYAFISSKPKKTFDRFQDVQIIAAKYENRKPNICTYQGGIVGSCNIETFIETDSSGFQNMYSAKNSWKKIAEIASERISNISKIKQYTVGGDISILLINPNGQTRWIQNEKKSEFITVTDYWKAYKKGKHKVVFTSTAAKERVEEYLKTIN